MAAERPQCVLLVGPSSAGKTSLARAVQRIADRPWFFYEGDVLSGGFPPARPEFVTVEWDHRVREGAARAARGLLEAGLEVIVELGLFDPWGRATVASVLSPFPTFVVRLRCDLEILERRELLREDRFPGTARSQAEQLEGLPFDHDILTDLSSPEVLAEGLLRTYWDFLGFDRQGRQYWASDYWISTPRFNAPSPGLPPCTTLNPFWTY